jgi:hypothetical protein
MQLQRLHQQNQQQRQQHYDSEPSLQSLQQQVNWLAPISNSSSSSRQGCRTTLHALPPVQDSSGSSNGYNSGSSMHDLAVVQGLPPLSSLLQGKSDSTRATSNIATTTTSNSSSSGTASVPQTQQMLGTDKGVVEISSSHGVMPTAATEGAAEGTGVPDIGPRANTAPITTTANSSGSKDASHEDSPGVQAALALLKWYKGVLSPMMQSTCRFLPTCSQYRSGSLSVFCARALHGVGL